MIKEIIDIIMKKLKKQDYEALLAVNKLENNMAYETFKLTNENVEKFYKSIINTIEYSIKHNSNPYNINENSYNYCGSKDRIATYQTSYYFSKELPMDVIKSVKNYFIEQGFIVKVTKSEKDSSSKKIIISWDFRK